MASVRDAPDPRPHVPALDGLRGLALLLVLLFHFGNLHDPAGWQAHWWRRLFAAGWCGVDLFFVLSGFLITGILLDARGSKGYFRNFYMRRVLRIFPLYYGVLVGVLLLAPVLGNAADEYRRLARGQVWFWLYTQNLLIVATRTWLPCGLNHFWSLAVEEQFYLFWPVVVFVCSRRVLWRVSVALVVLPLAVRVALALGRADARVAYVLTVARLDGFGAGAAVALLLRGGVARAALVRGGQLVVLGSALVLASLWARRGSLEWYSSPVQTLGFTALALCGAGVLAWSVATGPTGLLARALSVRPLRWLATYSYGIYVLHFPLSGCFTSLTRAVVFPALVRARLERYCGPVLLLTASALSILVGVLCYHLYEKHFLKLKRFFSPERTAGAPRFVEAVRQRPAA